MSDNSLPARVFEIGEMASLIARQLIPINSESAVNFACVCRCLQEPVLSALWETQPFLCFLLMALPGGVHFRLVEGGSHEVRQSYRP